MSCPKCGYCPACGRSGRNPANPPWDEALPLPWRVTPPLNSQQVEKDITDLRTIAEALDNAKRLGRPVDAPEGERVIQLSDTFARGLAAWLRGYANRMETTYR